MATQYTAGLTTGQVLTSATMNSIGAGQETYTPAWTSTGTQPALGNGQLSATYTRINKLVFVNMFLLVGSTTTFGTGNYRLSLPFSCGTGLPTIGFGTLSDASAGYLAYHTSLIVSSTSTTFEIYFTQAITPFGPTVPITLAVNDQLRLSLILQAT